jgi:diaphanous 1
MLSVPHGHRAVLAALSDYRVAYEEAFRFEQLISILRPSDPDTGTITPVEEDDGVWEARTATMALINALTNCPDALEDRVVLRDEFSRRGLNEAIVVCCSRHTSTVSLIVSGYIDFALHQTTRFSPHSTGCLY